MKRFIGLCLCACLLILSLASCGMKLFDPLVTEADGTAKSLPTLDSDRDANGALILTSSENRVVYEDDEGYIIFSFLGESVNKITRVLEFESIDDAKTYQTEQVKSAIQKGEQPPAIEVEGLLAIVPVGFSAQEGTLGFYYTKDKSTVLNDFAEEGVESR